jgi:hypothetical protein
VGAALAEKGIDKSFWQLAFGHRTLDYALWSLGEL